MNRKGLLLGLLIVAIMVLVWFFKKSPVGLPLQVLNVAVQTNRGVIEKRTTTPDDGVVEPPKNGFQQAQVHQAEIKQRDDQDVALWQSAIIYYGKVVDESNQPIAGVSVSYTANAMNEAREEVYHTGAVTSNERGLFKIDGVTGVGLMLQLSHPDYYPYPENSTGFSKRSLPKKGSFSDSEQNAELFRMHSKGHPVPLLHRSGGFHVPNDGTIGNFPLRGNTRAEILGQVQVQGWNRLRSGTYPFDWKVQLNVPGGGIIETTNYFDFVAPQAGYSTSAIIEVAGAESAAKTYFIQLSSGYVRLKVDAFMGKDLFFSGQYDFNSDGTPNLEPSQEINPTQ